MLSHLQIINGLIIIIIYLFLTIIFTIKPSNHIIIIERLPNEDRQNVHDENITESNLKKIKYLESINKLSKNELIFLNLKLAAERLPHRKEYISTVLTGNKTWLKIDEKYIFCLVCSEVENLNYWENFDKILNDCYENGYLVCMTGRIARYLSVFDGLPNILGKIPITKKILFNQALHKTQKILKKELDKNPELKKIYNSTNFTPEDEKKLEIFLNEIRIKVKTKIKTEFKLSDKKINELIAGI